jgi:hypothetical protein
MKGSRFAFFALSIMVLTGTAWGQAKAPAKERNIKGAPASAKASPEAALLANVQIVKASDGKWRCLSAGGRACSPDERQATTTVTKSRSNVKDNMVIAPDGTIQCITTSDNKPCADTVFQELSAEVKKAITKGGQSGF